MNGCFGSGYQPGDRCYDATWATTICLVSELNYMSCERFAKLLALVKLT